MKRLLDVIGALVLLVLLAPFALCIALLIKIDSPGPVFFVQKRVGLGLKDFCLFKFRSMRINNDGALVTAAGDNRITRVGRFLRSTKLDELPQLVNILRGEMSFVGPRPEVQKYVSLFEDDFRVITSVRPGLTDPASIHFFDESELLAGSLDPEQMYVASILPQKIALAKQYATSRSLIVDIQLVLQTVQKVLGKLLPARRGK